MLTVIKQPSEILYPRVRDAVAAITSVEVTPGTGAPAGAALTAVARMVGALATVSLSDGTDGEQYLVTVRMTTLAGETVEDEVEVTVVDAAWAMPDGGAPWISIVDFVRRFGLPEVIAMTAAAGSDRIDRELLIEKLTDAQAIAEAELSSRYALPLATVPRIVQAAIADLARARLYPRGVPQDVADAAKAATRTLERIGSGALSLGLPTMDAPASAPSDAPVLILQGRRAYPDGLADF